MCEFFDKNQGWRISQGNLPHWYQPGVTYFVTFRTADSVPHDLIRAWRSDRRHWLQQHGIDPLATDWKAQVRSSAKLEREYHSRFTRVFMEYLDQGLGECRMRDRRAAKVVAESLTHFDGVRYHLGDFVVMPNHVQVLVGLPGKTEIEAVCESWKHFTAREINRLLGRRGRFWQEESFDHLVRGPEQLGGFRRYIAENPEKAGLPEGTFLLRLLKDRS
jgi:REP element-mobilizing transposase RayT